MMRYAVINAAGLVIGTGQTVNIDDMIKSSPEGCTTTGLGDDEFPEAMLDYLGEDERFHPTPERPGDWAAWSGAEWIDPRTEEDLRAEAERLMVFLRSERDRRLLASDWAETPAAEARLAPDVFAAWADYRQALRDMPETTTDPASPVWPTSPK